MKLFEINSKEWKQNSLDYVSDILNLKTVQSEYSNSLIFDQNTPKNNSDEVVDKTMNLIQVKNNFEHSTTYLLKNFLAIWKNDLYCDTGVLIECDPNQCLFQFNINDLPVKHLENGLTLIKLHSMICHTCPLLRLILQKRNKKTNKNRKIHSSNSSYNDLEQNELDINQNINGLSPSEESHEVVNPKDKLSWFENADLKMLTNNISLPHDISLNWSHPDIENVYNDFFIFSLNKNYIEGNAFIRMMLYMYTGLLELSESTIVENLRAAYFLHLDGAIKLCFEYLIGILNPFNILPICALSNILNEKILEKAAHKFLITHFVDITTTDSWCKLPAEVVSRILCTDNIVCKSEVSIVQAIFRWVTYVPKAITDEIDKDTNHSLSHSKLSLDENVYDETRLKSFDKMLNDGCVRFLHLSDYELENLASDIKNRKY